MRYGELQTIFRKISDIKKYPNNPRTIEDEQFMALVLSIKENPEYLFARPVLLSNRTGILVCFAGNQRLDGARKAGLKEIPSILFENLTEEKEKELLLRDNIQNGKWDQNVLKDEFSDLDLPALGLDIFDTMPMLDMDREIQAPDRMQVKPFNKTHILLSFPPEKLIDIQEIIEQVVKIPGVEYEQSSN